jgi:hypothetical protein
VILGSNILSGGNGTGASFKETRMEWERVGFLWNAPDIVLARRVLFM